MSALVLLRAGKEISSYMTIEWIGNSAWTAGLRRVWGRMWAALAGAVTLATNPREKECLHLFLSLGLESQS